MRYGILFVIIVSILCSAIPRTHAQSEAERSKPIPVPLVDAIPLSRDVAFPGTIDLQVDATDTTQGIYRIKETIPVATPGPLTLLYPQWLPGHHSPTGAIEKLAGLKISAGDKAVGWFRDPLNVYAFHIDVPKDVTVIVAEFQFLSATTSEQGRIVMTDKMLSLQWESVSLYPAGFFVRRIPVKATVKYPESWEAFSALRGKKVGPTVEYELTDYEVLIDSPVVAGKYSKTADLGHGATLNMVADSRKELDAKPKQIEAHKKLVDEAVALFGARHFDHYDFLLSISDELGHIGLEHHRSSENGVSPGYFTHWDDGPGARNLLPHEFTHSWNGKFRRSELLWTPNYNVPMQDNLLWVYEGQTQFWGYVLGARSGLYTKAQTLDALAVFAAYYDATAGRTWRPLEDTTFDPVISTRRPKGWNTWQRGEDYYNEGMLMWLEADGIIRQKTAGAKGLDDFAKAFFGINDGDFGEVTYSRQIVIDTLNGIAPYDWTGFFREHVDQTSTEAPKKGLSLGGYKLVYNDKPSTIAKAHDQHGKDVDQLIGIGLKIKNDGNIDNIGWDSPAFKSGVTKNTKVIAVNGIEFSGEEFKDAITEAKESKKPITLLVKDGKNIHAISIEYFGGLRYAHLEKSGDGEGSLDVLLKPKTY